MPEQNACYRYITGDGSLRGITNYIPGPMPEEPTVGGLANSLINWKKMMLMITTSTSTSASLLSSILWGIYTPNGAIYPHFWGFFLSGGVRLYRIPEFPERANIPDK